MKLEKLVKTLRRELVANPMKAGVLGVLLLGGMYFWGPLLWKWMGKKEAAAPAVAAVSSPPQEPVGVQTPSGAAEFKWREIRDRREADRLVRSAKFRPEWSQVFFHAAAAVTIASQPQKLAEAKKQLELDPGKLGLVLQGVAIGPKTKKAVISGKVYRELDWITISQSSSATHNKDDQQPDLKFRLLRVFRKMVEVEHEGKTWPLKLVSAEIDNPVPVQDSQPERPQGDPAEKQAAAPVAKKAGQDGE